MQILAPFSPFLDKMLILGISVEFRGMVYFEH